MLKTNIVDSSNNLSACVVDGEELPALVVATRDFKTFNNKPSFFTNDTYGVDMNKNATFGGTPILIYDENAGTPGEWTTSSLSGTWTFNSATQKKNGSVSIAQITTLPASDNSVMQLAKGSTQDLTGYTAITGWIYLTASGTEAINIGAYASGILVGNLVDIKTYINTGTLNVWQSFTISLVDLNLVGKTIDSFRIAKVNRASTFYLDYIQVQETGTPLEYKIEPSKLTWLYVSSVRFIIIDAYDSTLSNNSMPKLPYNSFLAVSKLTNGIVGRIYNSGVSAFSAIYRQLSDLMNTGNAIIDNYTCDGTNTFITVTMKFDVPIILKSETQDYMSYTISDDLSGLLEFRIVANCKEETRKTTIDYHK